MPSEWQLNEMIPPRQKHIAFSVDKDFGGAAFTKRFTKSRLLFVIVSDRYKRLQILTQYALETSKNEAMRNHILIIVTAYKYRSCIVVLECIFECNQIIGKDTGEIHRSICADLFGDVIFFTAIPNKKNQVYHN